MTRRFSMAMLAVFVASVAVTVAMCRSMDCGMVWMPMPIATFLAMWIAMMVAMMLPSLAPVLSRRSTRLQFALGYFAVWTLFGVAAYFAGNAISRSALPRVAAAIALVMAGAVQLTRWKLHHLNCCRSCNEDGWRGGLRYGVHCSLCCSTLIIALLVVGVMNLAAMAVITVAITAERVMPRAPVIARAIGAAMIVYGACACATSSFQPGNGVFVVSSVDVTKVEAHVFRA